MWVLVGVAGIACGRLSYGELSGGARSGDGGLRDSLGDGPGSDATCPGPLVRDDFDDGVIDSTVWAVNPGTITSIEETNGQLVVRLGANTTDDWAAVVGYQTHDLTNDRVFVEVVQVPNAAQSGQGAIHLGLPGVSYLSFEIQYGQLAFAIVTSGVPTTYDTLAYDPVLHRWWQIRGQGGMLYFEVSSDGIGWQVAHARPTTEDLSRVYVNLTGGVNGVAEPSPGEVHFDNFNTSSAPCP